MVGMVWLVLLFGSSCLCTFDTCKKHNITVLSQTPIGTGCSASVYMCEYGKSERAVKIFSDAARQKREMEMAEHIRALDLPITPKIYLIADNLIVMDLARGRSMKALLAEFRNDRNTLGKALTKIFEAMFVLHRSGIVHVDLHGQNIIVGDGLDVKIIDFGDSWKSNDFIIDFQILKHKVLDHIDGWESLVHFDNRLDERPLALIKEFYGSDEFRWVFETVSHASTPRVEYCWIRFFRKVFFIMNRSLEDLSRRYELALLHSSMNSSFA